MQCRLNGVDYPALISLSVQLYLYKKIENSITKYYNQCAYLRLYYDTNIIIIIFAVALLAHKFAIANIQSIYL